MGKRKKDLSEFGEFLVAEICKTGMSKVDFCTAVGINKPYFYERFSWHAPIAGNSRVNPPRSAGCKSSYGR